LKKCLLIKITVLYFLPVVNKGHFIKMIEE